MKEKSTYYLNVIAVILLIGIIIIAYRYDKQNAQAPSQLPPHVNLAPIPIYDSQWDGIWMDEYGESLAFSPRMDGVYEGKNENVHITFSVMEQNHDYGHAMFCVKQVCRADLIIIKDNTIRDVSFDILHLHRSDE